MVLPALAAWRCLCRGSAARPAAPRSAGGPMSSSRSTEYKKGIFLHSKSTARPRGTEHKSLPCPSFPCLSTFFFRGPAAFLADSPRPSLKSWEQPVFLHQVVISLLGTQITPRGAGAAVGPGFRHGWPPCAALQVPGLVSHRGLAAGLKLRSSQKDEGTRGTFLQRRIPPGCC